jgi:hypothetical protein
LQTSPWIHSPFLTPLLLLCGICADPATAHRRSLPPVPPPAFGRLHASPAGPTTASALSSGQPRVRHAALLPPRALLGRHLAAVVDSARVYPPALLFRSKAFSNSSSLRFALSRTLISPRAPKRRRRPYSSPANPLLAVGSHHQPLPAPLDPLPSFSTPYRCSTTPPRRRPLTRPSH